MTTSLLRPQMNTCPSCRKPRSPVLRNGPGEGLARALGVLPVAAHDARAGDAKLAHAVAPAADGRSSRRPERRRGSSWCGKLARRTRRGARRSRRPRGRASPRPSPRASGRRRSIVFIPSPSSVKAMASDDSAIPYDGRSASLLEADARERARRSASSVSGRMGSAPQPATRQVDRSSPSSSAALMRLTQSA